MQKTKISYRKKYTFKIKLVSGCQSTAMPNTKECNNYNMF
jgi:hypothetical protein